MSPEYLSEDEARKLARYYRVLEIGTRAPAWAIKHQYRRLAKIWHPDKHASDPIGQKEAEHRMRLIIEAYNCIRDAPLRSYQMPKAPRPKAKPVTPRPKAKPVTQDIDLSALNTPMPVSETETYLQIGCFICFCVPFVFSLWIGIYIFVTYGIDLYVQEPGIILFVSPGIFFAAFLLIGLWEVTHFGDWLVKKIWGR